VAQSEEEALRAQIAKLEQDAKDALEERSSLVWQVRYSNYQSF
jgi:cell division protein FtsB